ncbi:2-aminoethylphosphonate ABC transporter substrate-binding protein [Kitasatospora sp. NBC_00240]|uniref:2-aminoethylphosphonate ABC transporter substrate-binding protein n=1 Tax=Kitasatospora sp. NBC_00240 TaxID=2903567 RepID=UPI0022593D64|nr:2-aminoethylphosphonate ABC transporter substrate-binding protein [Kitasatospora sp. NBC_00240]MCX5208493.1 2-aminoethylphosphonate ABC transporter substrate-binding protein [Kitasatospora sp. NBC_00240]
MHARLRSLTAALAALALGGPLAACSGSSAQSGGDAKEITVYSADGLKAEDGNGFYDKAFKDFTAATGIKVNYVEGGSGEMVQRLLREKSNTKADLVVTLPPFIQSAASQGLLENYRPAGSDQVADGDKDPAGAWTSVVKNYLCFIYNSKEVAAPPKTWDDLLDGKYKNKLQYSTPGVAGDGTAVLIKAMHDFGGIQGATDFLGKLQKNNVGPSSSTGQLAPKVNKGELLVANGDVQMNFANRSAMPNQAIWFPAAKDGRPSTFSLPYAAGVVKNAPHRENARKLLDHLLTQEVQQQATTLAGGFPARADVTPGGDNAAKLSGLLDGVELFTPDWNDIDANLKSYVGAWKQATGS